jgi:hypothetical protein
MPILKDHEIPTPVPTHPDWNKPGELVCDVEIRQLAYGTGKIIGVFRLWTEMVHVMQPSAVDAIVGPLSTEHENKASGPLKTRQVRVTYINGKQYVVRQGYDKSLPYVCLPANTLGVLAECLPSDNG